MQQGNGTLTTDARLRDACLGFSERHPDISARRVVTWGQLVALGGFVGALGFAIWVWPEFMARCAQIAFWATFMALTVLRLFAAGASLKGATPPLLGSERVHEPVYSILCPLYREAGSVRALADALDRLAYPKDRLEILFIVEEDDAATRAALDALAPALHRRVIVTPFALPRTKPKALNYGLSFATGAYVAVFDAEDVPHPAQLRAALDAFAAGGERLAAVQSPLRVDNGKESWIASQFAAEYAIQFRAILPLLAHVGAPLPLGGAGNHFRREALADVGGWDPHNVTEDADIAYRLARRGWRLGVIAPPTFEEGPASLGAWLRQRTRWIKGHVQTWLVLMRNPARCAREMGFRGFLWMQLVLLGGLLSAFAHAPLIGLVVLSLAAPAASPFHLADWTLLITGYTTAVLGAVFAAAVERDARLALSAVTMPLYWPLATLAGVGALLEIMFKPHYWAKTEHGLSAHRQPN